MIRRVEMITDHEVEQAIPPSGFLRSYLDYARGVTDAPLTNHLLSGLALLSVAAPKDLERPWFGTPLYATFYGLIIGRTADDRKSASIGIAENILREVDPARNGVLPGSREGTLDALTANPQMLVYMSEFGNFLGHTGRKGSYGSSIRPTLTDAWDGKSLVEALAHGKARGPESPRLSILAGSTLGFIEAYTSDKDWESGFLNRWVCLIGNNGERFLATPQDHLFERQRARAIAELGQLVSAETAGTCLGFTAEAEQVWGQWSRDLNRRRREATNELVTAATGRVGVHTAKIALLYSLMWGRHLDRGAWRTGVEEVAWAIQVGELIYRSMAGLIPRLAANEEMRQRRQILYLLREDWRGYPAVLRDSGLLKRRFDWVLDTLEAEGSIERSKDIGGVDALRRIPLPDVELSPVMPTPTVAWTTPEGVGAPIQAPETATPRSPGLDDLSPAELARMGG